MMTVPANADGLKDEIAPTGKLRVAIAISPAGGAFWSTKTEAAAMPACRSISARKWRRSSAFPSNMSRIQNSGQITDAAAKGVWDVTFLPQGPGARDQDVVRADL